MNLHRNRIIAETPSQSNCFIGFHDIIPWSHDNSMLAIHRANPDYFELSACDNPIDICLWNPESGEIQAIDSTRGWNLQQGSRLQWVPAHPGILAFNAIENNKAVGVLRDIHSGERRVFDTPIYTFSPNGKTSITVNFTRLAHMWKAYGYPALAVNPLVQDVDGDGLWKLDLETGTSELFISTRRAAEFEATSEVNAEDHFLCHVSFSPNGERIAFLDRYFSKDYALVTRMIVTDKNAKAFKIVAQGGVSHFDWIDNDTILVWTRFSSALATMRSRGVLGSPLLKPLLKLGRSFKGTWKKRLLSEAYYGISVVDPSNRFRFGFPELNSDGHPMIARSHPWVLTDFYPDAKNQMPVMLYRPEDQRRIDLHRFTHHPRSKHTDDKCDLHPRWNRDETLVAVDTCEDGYRQVRILDARDIVNS
jgi:hypothetical protein